ncbi:uncharacterized protein [Musca autumnalis]|uniref:uncharacterized protein n=1 Tax=Musca autumnalis TaxID=221902 RepID=UPI003CEF375B
MSSKRSLRREISRKSRDYLKRLRGKQFNQKDFCQAEGNNNVDVLPVYNENSQFDPFLEDLPVCDESSQFQPTLRDKLRDVFLKHNVSRSLGDDILAMLREENLNVPSTSIQLLNYNKQPTLIRTVNPGQYYHFGLKKQISKLGNILENTDSIVLDVGIDGLPLFKSSSVSLWPILGKIVNLNVPSIFLIGVYCGVKKPVCVNAYLHDFIVDLKVLLREGIQYGDKNFVRKPRTIDEIKRWKATEFRQFLLYTGVVVLKDIIDDDTYYHFLLLHCAYRLLCCPYSYKNNVDSAEILLQDFVKFFENIYGEQNVTYNVHNLLHICECVREHGLVTEFSAYDFENYMQCIKKSIKKNHQILQQIRNKFEERAIIIQKFKFNYSKRKGKLISVNNTNCYISHIPPNNLVMLQKNDSLDSVISYYIKTNMNNIEQEMSTIKQKLNEIFARQEEIVKILGEHNVLLRRNLGMYETSQAMFPICTEEKLKEVENHLQTEKKLEVIGVMRKILQYSIKNIDKVLGKEIIMAYNVDGIKNKKPLKQYGNFLCGVYDAVKSEGLTYEDYLCQLRNSLKRIKNTINKTNSRKTLTENKN